jgi:L-threonine kinase
VTAPIFTEPTGRLAHAGLGRAFGTYGELLQGVLTDDVDFLVTLPIDCWTTARFEPADRGGLTVHPHHRTKSLALARMACHELGHPASGRLTLTSDLPVGKGLASSSADLVATARAVAVAFGAEFTTDDIETLLRRIEPSDGVMYSGVVAYHHREVRLREWIGRLPAMTIVGVDEGGQIDTIAFNRIPKPFDDGDKAEYARLLADLVATVRASDLTGVGAVATRSATLNQKLRPKRLLEPLRRICDEAGGLGVVAAHSGTALGILLAADDVFHAEKLAHCRRECRALAGNVHVYRSLSG